MVNDELQSDEHVITMVRLITEQFENEHEMFDWTKHIFQKVRMKVNLTTGFVSLTSSLKITNIFTIYSIWYTVYHILYISYTFSMVPPLQQRTRKLSRNFVLELKLWNSMTFIFLWKKPKAMILASSTEPDYLVDTSIIQPKIIPRFLFNQKARVFRVHFWEIIPENISTLFIEMVFGISRTKSLHSMNEMQETVTLKHFYA